MKRVPPCSEADLLRRAATWPEYPGLNALTPEALRQVSARYGIDFATALLYQRLVSSSRHGPAIAAVSTAGGRPNGEEQVVILPGAFYRASPQTGADGRLVREAAEQLGYPTALVPLNDFDRLDASADLLAGWLKRNADRPSILVSLSKGAADIRRALARPDAAVLFRPVRAWVDLSGLFFGTPLVNWLRRQRLRWWLIRLLFWYWGYPFGTLADLEHGTGPDLADLLAAAPHLRVIHVVGFPLRQHLTTPLSRRGHRRLSPLGPNDGTISLIDVLRLPGVVYPVWGADHYLRPGGQDLRPLVARILSYLALELAPAALTAVEPNLAKEFA